MAKITAGNPPVFHFVMIKPTHYDDDGYPVQWFRSAIPSNTLACLNGLAEDAQCAADVLVVDESIGERDPAAEKGGQSGRVQVMPRRGEQVLRAVVSVGGLWGARSRS